MKLFIKSTLPWSCFFINTNAIENIIKTVVNSGRITQPVDLIPYNWVCSLYIYVCVCVRACVRACACVCVHACERASEWVKMAVASRSTIISSVAKCSVGL
jgi:hypothetical protein